MNYIMLDLVGANHPFYIEIWNRNIFTLPTWRVASWLVTCLSYFSLNPVRFGLISLGVA
ncbi:hypothetical protein [Burkholderia sp. Bp9012]|uniref:hypothetical protein n=1 Tax=Burkholderia sp. Bp9012 TaxID=2184562 RepID=UPI001625F6EA|nr:hypothetical protein [Burkholderia sp. Bp9012]